MATLHSPLMTPVLPAAGHVGATPSNLISPSTQRHPFLATPASVNVPQQQLVLQQDDAHERKERRRSRLLEMQRRNLGSPATPTEKRKSLTTPSAGLTNAQLADHYGTCIKLSAENKINAKNAFGLHLIDYLSELLKKKEMNNFQVASSTLDASAKIYAGRVDAIHSETYKVLTGLGRSSDRCNSEGGGGDEDGDRDNQEGDGKDAQKNKKRRRKKATVETNLKNINVKKVDMEFEVDPLFQKTSATFDEGGSGGLLLNHLSCLDDTSNIAVDLNTLASSETDALESQRKPSDMTAMQELYSSMALEDLRICPEFADFSFTNWSKDGEEDMHTTMTSKMAKDTDRRFDMDAEVEQIADIPEINDDDNDMGMPIDDFTGNDDEDQPQDNDATMINRLESGTTVITIGNSSEAKLVESAMHDLTKGSVSSLMSVLASEPSEYSYFSTNILQSWAGPEHWKLKPKSKDEKSIDGEKKDTKKSRKRKEPCLLTAEDVDEEVIEKSFKETRAATTLTMRTLTKNSKASTTLPEDLQYEAKDLLKLATKPKVMVRLMNSGSDDVDDGVGNYDYSNDNDKENFVPDLQGGDDDMDDFDPGDTQAGFDFSAGDVFTQSQDPAHSDNGDDPNTSVFKGDNLLLQPNKVAKIEIGYAKTAKRVDVKRLKNSMWTLLCTETPVEDENANKEDKSKKEEEKKKKAEAGGSGDDIPKVAGEHKFSELVKDLPNKVSKNMAKNLSVPIAFVCLLHLANEKTLKIEDDEDMSDLRITQGLKQFLNVHV